MTNPCIIGLMATDGVQMIGHRLHPKNMTSYAVHLFPVADLH